jgi:predicted KAP-like P-loop ATPase
MAADYKSMSVSSDQPITKGSQDLFGRSDFAQRVAEVISSFDATGSIVISINGPWGEGKTSLLNLIDEHLTPKQNCIVIRFNPWRFPEEELLLSRFFSTVAARLSVDLKTVSEKIGDGLKKLAKLSSPLQFAGVSSAGARDALDLLFHDADLEETKKRVSDVLLEAPKRVVVLFDDIDRLEKREIQAVFRMVKLTADFPNTCYVLAFDDQIVAGVLAEQFGGQNGGRSFLEKIVQVPLPVPPASAAALRKMAFQSLDSVLEHSGVELAQNEANLFRIIFDKSFQRMLRTPRAVKRYANMLSFALPILKGEADILDLILIEGVRAFFPKLYKAVWSDPDVFLRDSLEFQLSSNKKEWEQKLGETLEGALTGLTKEDSNGAMLVLHELFPAVAPQTLAGSRMYSRGKPKDKTKRICQSEYFYRYFNFGIPLDDVRDEDVLSLVSAIGDTSSEDLEDALGKLARGNRMQLLIQKLGSYEDRIAAENRCKLAFAIARWGDLIPASHPENSLFGIGSLAEAANLLRRLVGGIGDRPTRDATARKIVDLIEQLPFAYEYYHRVKKLKKDHFSDEYVAVISEECEAEVARIVARKLSQSANTQPLEDSHPLWKRQFYIHWRWHDQASLQAYARQRLEQHPADVGKFLTAILGLSELESSEFIPISDSAGEYQFVAAIFDLDQLVGAINSGYPQPLDRATPQAVRWFVTTHQSQSDSEAMQEEPPTSGTESSCN